MRKLAVGFFALALGVVAAAPAIAHHSFAAEFDASKSVSMKGYVTKVEWTNPHVWFYIDVKKTDGTVIATTIHPPSDSSLLSDGVRVLSRLVGRAKAVVGAVATPRGALFRNRTHSARRLARVLRAADGLRH